MRAAEFLDAPAEPVARSAAAFLDEPTARSASALLDSGVTESASGAPTAAELETASRPARAIRTRQGGTLFVPEAELQARDNWDRDVQGEQQAPWTGEGGVIESLPAQMVAGTRSAVANLRRMMSEESAAQRRLAVAGPTMGETPAGAVTGRAAPGAIERQTRLLAEDETAISAAVRDAEIAMGDLRLVTPRNMNLAQEAVSSLAQSAPPTALGIAAGILTRNPALAMTIAGGGGGVVQAGSTYGEARSKGAPHRLSSTAATIDAILEGVGEALPLRIAIKRGSPIAARIYGTMAAEAGQEAATQAMQDLNAYATYNPDITFNEAWRNLKVATLAGGMGGGLYGSIGAAADASRRKPSPLSEGEAVARIIDAPTVDEAIASANIAVDDVVADNVPRQTIEPSAPAGVSGPTLPAVSAPMRAQDFLDEAPAATQAAGPAAFAETAAPSVDVAPQSAGAFLDVTPEASTAAPATRAVVPAEKPAVLQEAVAPLPATTQPFADKAAVSGEGMRAADFLDQDASTESQDTSPQQPVATRAVDTASNQEKPLEQTTAKEDWAAFPPDSRTLGVPRAEMPQIKAEHRGALINFLKARDVTSQKEEVAADSLKATQAEYSPSKVKQAQDFEGGDRSILISSDNHIVDGHHQWLAKAAKGEKIQVIRLDAPIKDLLPLVSEFPSVQVAQGQATELSAGAGIVMTPPYAAAGGEVQDPASARPDAIRQAIRTLFKVPLNEGHFKQSRDTLGIYKVKPQTIRVRNQNDIGVIAHETGHHFSETSRPVREFMKAHAGELSKITPYAAQQKTVALQREEGFAEYLRLLWTQPAQAESRAPGFHAAFANYIEKNGHRPAFEKIAGAIRDWQNLPPADRILAKVGQAPERPDPKALRDRFIFEVLDKWLPLKRMVHDLNPGIAPGKDPFKAAHLLAGDGAIIEDWITSNTIPFDPVRRADPKNYGKPLRAILQPVADDIRAFNAYLIARRAAELTEHGKERLFTPEEIRAGLSLETPVFKQAAKEIYAYNDSLIDYAIEGGLLSPAIAGKFRQYSAYIPFFRESRDGDGHGGGKNPFKRLLGGTENLRDPIANLIQNTANIIYATNRNAMLVKARGLANSVRGGGRWIEDIPIPDAVLNVPTRSVLDAFERQGVTLDQDSLQALQQIQRLVVPSPVDDSGERIVVARVSGEIKALQINNEMLWKALQSFEPADLGFIEQILTVPADLLRAGVTLSPEFMARNFMRDTLSGFIQSKAGIIPVAGTVSGFKEVATRSDAARLFRSFGGGYADMWKGDSQQTKSVLERMAKRGRFDPRTILTPGGIIQLLNDLGSITEAGTRVAEFKATMQPGDVDSLTEAAYNAREVSVDFGMHGASQNIRLLTRITPFLNPAMQGFYKMARTTQERFIVTLLRGSMLTAFSVALFMLNRDEDWYDEIETWERNVYWHINVGFKTDDGKVLPIRIPKPFEWGALFGTVPESLVKVAVDQNGGEFGKRLKSVVTDVFSLRAIPTAVLVPMEQWANRSMFTGRPIISEGLERLDPELQYNAGTSLAAREAGNTLGVSPARIDHAIRGFLGTMGVYATSIADLAIRSAGDYPAKPSPTMRDIPLVRAFVHDPTTPNSRYVTEFYETLQKARRADATYKLLPPERADDYYDRHRQHIDLTGDANMTARDISALRRENTEILESREYTSRDKMEMIRDNNIEIKFLSRQFARENARP